MTKTLIDPSKEFSGRRALITGGSRGIGAAIAQRLLDGGATVAVTARSRTETTPKNATFVPGDIRSNEGAKNIAAEALGVLGGIDILVNNAGATRVYAQGSASIPDEEWLDSLNISYLSAVRLTNAVLPALKNSKTGAIINISSGGSAPPPAPLLHYLSAKAALVAYSRGLAQELALNKIRVNVITPGGFVVTPGGDEVRKLFTDALGIPAEQIFKVPLGRPGQPEDLAEAVAFLASDRAQWITGQNCNVDGGASQ
jgi:NAD(P)-dependent dehydrogenase (short-subunit alcohol dehydrogenase family)